LALLGPTSIKAARKMFMKLTPGVNVLGKNTGVVSNFDKAFNPFGQAKFPYGGSVLGSSQFSILPQLPQKNDT